jgi:hypothetical protein
MIYLIVVAASFGVYVAGQGPKTCNCTTSQNTLMVDQGTLYVKEFTPKKCSAHLYVFVNVAPDSAEFQLTRPYTVTLHSSRIGKISEQTVIGAPRVTIDERIVLRKKEKLWIEVQSKGKFLVSVVPIR